MPYITMKEMLETGVHFGHQTRRWNPKMRPYIFGARKGIHIIDLQQTIPLFDAAYEFILDVVANKGKVLFVGTKRQARDIIQEEATRAGMFHVTQRWMGGTLTNFRTIKKRIDYLIKLEEMFEDGSINRFPKKEIVGMHRELEKLRAALGGIKNMDSYPQAGFLVDPRREDIAVQEFRRLGIPIVAVTDTNCDPDLVDYVLPGNDDAIRAIKLFTSRIADACLQGKASQEERGEEAAREEMQKAAAETEPAAEAQAESAAGDVPKEGAEGEIQEEKAEEK
ncbi:MAG: 30S ribosomal protein S2 [Desulfohalobiaceae bacterium]|nr:30S ribosomal protein S2 [Desulfohalobiaceae bacterium]